MIFLVSITNCIKINWMIQMKLTNTHSEAVNRTANKKESYDQVTAFVVGTKFETCDLSHPVAKLCYTDWPPALGCFFSVKLPWCIRCTITARHPNFLCTWSRNIIRLTKVNIFLLKLRYWCNRLMSYFPTIKANKRIKMDGHLIINEIFGKVNIFIPWSKCHSFPHHPVEYTHLKSHWVI